MCLLDAPYPDAAVNNPAREFLGVIFCKRGNMRSHTAIFRENRISNLHFVKRILCIAVTSGWYANSLFNLDHVIAPSCACTYIIPQQSATP
jgi:hypothetical protein